MMSGIVGVFSKNDNADLRYIVKKMLEMIKHRGNKSIIYSNKNVTIGFRQLKSNEEKKEQNNSNIVFIDGLIYNTNFVAGKNPHSLVDSDEDILDYAYKKNLIHVLDGNFSFCIWDDKKLVIGTDINGSKTVYYMIDGDNVYFASEIKSIIGITGNANLNMEAVYDFLVLGSVLSPKTFFKGINKIPPGTLLEVNKKEVKLTKYAGTRGYYKTNKISFLKNEFLKLFKESTKNRLSKVKNTGVFLSGGIDSSAIVSMLSELTDDISTYSACYNYEEPINESRFARMIADEFNTDHHEIYLESSSIKKTPLTIWYQEVPNQNPAPLIVHSLSETSKNKQLLFSGEGVEELFWGGKDYAIIRYLEKFNINFINPYDLFIKFKGVFPDSKLNDPSIKNYSALASLTENIDVKKIKNISSAYNKIRYKVWISDYIFYRDNYITPHSHYITYPFLSNSLLKFSFSLPPSLKVRNLKTKWFFKQVFENKLPKLIIERKKQMLVSPSKIWIKENEDVIDYYIDKLLERKILDRDRILHLIKDKKFPRSDWRIWSLFFLENFLEMFFDNKIPSKPPKKL